MAKQDHSIKGSNVIDSIVSTADNGYASVAAGALPLIGSLKSKTKLIDAGSIALEISKVLVTGVAGFIGFHVAKYLLEQGFDVVGIDNLNNYYSKKLKEDRVKVLKKLTGFKFYQADICDYDYLKKLSNKYQFKTIIHLAAQAGVRYSLTNPFEYTKTNVQGHLNILELCRYIKNFEKLIYASSSSVYGNNKKLPFSTDDRTDEPISLYAATKKSAELITYSYSHLYRINAIGLRFFTVYGPWGRPDMAIFKFTKSIIEETSLELFNNGNMKRDFTYIDDIVYGIMGAMNLKFLGHSVYNLGNNKPEDLNDIIQILESTIGKKAMINFSPMQPGDVEATWADISDSKRDLSFKPITTIQTGIPKFVEWYKEYYSK